MDIEGTSNGITKAEEHHGRNPTARILQRKAVFGELVPLCSTPDKMVYGARRVDFGCILAGFVCPLFARQDMEVIVCCVSSRVALGADGRAEDDQVFVYAY